MAQSSPLGGRSRSNLSFGVLVALVVSVPIVVAGCVVDEGVVYYDCPCDQIIGVCECSCDIDCGPPGPPECSCDYTYGVCDRGCPCDVDCYGGPPGSDGTPGKGGYVDMPCNNPADCTEPLSCLVNGDDNSSWCASICSVDTDCGTDGCCLASDSDGNFCFPPRYCPAPGSSADGGVVPVSNPDGGAAAADGGVSGYDAGQSGGGNDAGQSGGGSDGSTQGRDGGTAGGNDGGSTSADASGSGSADAAGFGL